MERQTPSTDDRLATVVGVRWTAVVSVRASWIIGVTGGVVSTAGHITVSAESIAAGSVPLTVASGAVAGGVPVTIASHRVRSASRVLVGVSVVAGGVVATAGRRALGVVTQTTLSVVTESTFDGVVTAGLVAISGETISAGRRVIAARGEVTSVGVVASVGVVTRRRVVAARGRVRRAIRSGVTVSAISARLLFVVDVTVLAVSSASVVVTVSVPRWRVPRWTGDLIAGAVSVSSTGSAADRSGVSRSLGMGSAGVTVRSRVGVSVGGGVGVAVATVLITILVVPKTEPRAPSSLLVVTFLGFTTVVSGMVSHC